MDDQNEYDWKPGEGMMTVGWLLLALGALLLAAGFFLQPANALFSGGTTAILLAGMFYVGGKIVRAITAG